jgi:HPt (histidine-containing phosphotransfer) domain-containing protein
MTCLDSVRPGSSVLPLESWINWTNLYDMCDDSPEFALELLHIFVEDTRKHLKSLETAIATQAVSQIKYEAHHIKGASANLGLVLLQRAATELENTPLDALLPTAAITLCHLHQALESVQMYLDQSSRPAISTSHLDDQ